MLMDKVSFFFLCVGCVALALLGLFALFVIVMIFAAPVFVVIYMIGEILKALV